MTLQQLRTICEIVANDYSVSRAALAMHASQPAVSKMLATLERELGADVFIRAKGRIAGLTEFGANVHTIANRMLHDAMSLADMASDAYMEERGRLRIAATHLHARHAVLRAVTEFKPTYPLVDVEIWQRNPQGVIDLVASGESHVGVGTLPSTLPEDVVTLAAYRVERCVITPLGHPLLAQKRITLQDVAKYPMVAYDRSFVSGRAVQAEFERHGLQPRQVLKATGADVVKAAVAAGLGIAVFQSAAIDPEEDKRLGIIEARHLFPGSEAHIVLRRGQFLRRFTYAFIARVAPQLTPAIIDKAIAAR